MYICIKFLNIMIDCNNEKGFFKEFQIIDTLNNLTSTPVSVFENDIFISEAIIVRDKKNIELELPILIDEDRLEKITIKTEFGDLLSTTLNICSKGSSFNEKGASFKTVCSFQYLKNNDFSTDYVSKFRCFIPIETSKLHSFRFQLESMRHCDSNTNYALQCVRINIEDIQFDILQVKSKSLGYYVIDSFQELSFEMFGDYCFAIQQAIGFIMGYMPGGEIFYFSSNKDFYYTNRIRPAMNTMYYPIYTNPYGFIQFKGTSAENYNNKLNVMPAKEFSKLVSLIYSNERFSAIILMMIESASSCSLLLIPSIYAIILESLSKIICTPITNETRPVNDKKLFNIITAKINKVIDSYTDDFKSNDDILKLKNRIPELNKIVKQAHLSNDQKLILPFEQLGINLTTEDIDIIKHRNDLLHGNTLLTNDVRTQICDINNYMDYASGKLYTLISSLILKYIGYNGYIINHAKASEKACNIETEDDYYKLI